MAHAHAHCARRYAVSLVDSYSIYLPFPRPLCLDGFLFLPGSSSNHVGLSQQSCLFPCIRSRSQPKCARECADSVPALAPPPRCSRPSMVSKSTSVSFDPSNLFPMTPARQLGYPPFCHRTYTRGTYGPRGRSLARSIVHTISLNLLWHRRPELAGGLNTRRSGASRSPSLLLPSGDSLHASYRPTSRVRSYGTR